MALGITVQGRNVKLGQENVNKRTEEDKACYVERMRRRKRKLTKTDNNSCLLLVLKFSFRFNLHKTKC